MYNMEISIGSYKFRGEILILIVVVSWILFGHLLCGCSRVGLIEGMAIVKQTLANKRSKNKPADVSTSGFENASGNTMTPAPLSDEPLKEGFVGANDMASGPAFAEASSADYIMNPSKWSMPTLTFSPGTTPDAGVKTVWNRPKQPIPLPEGELDVFATTDFKPECCPNAYSSSTGCACMDVGTYNYLRERGGNNIPYSEY